MPNTPQDQFDQTVLDLIEHSPTGAVPHTPTYQEALGRLRAAHQVYPSADHKGGLVTARSLAAKPGFYASNLEAFLAGRVDGAELEQDAAIFERYVASLPAAVQGRAREFQATLVARRAHHRARHGEVARDPVHTLFLVPGSGPHPGLPGDYLHGALLQTPAELATGEWELHVHDSLDGVAECRVASLDAAREKFEEVMASAPFLLGELKALGFSFNY